MSAKFYSGDRVSVIIAGIPITGYADGEFMRIVKDNDDFGDVIGTDGEVARWATGDDRGTATLLLLQTSSSNALLSALSRLDKSQPGGAGVGNFLVRDQGGSSIYRADQCWVLKPPDVSFGREVGSREWPIRLAKIERTDGGN